MKSFTRSDLIVFITHGLNIIIHGVIVTFALLTLLAGNTDHFMGDFFADLFSLIFLFTSGISFLGCVFFLGLLIMLRKHKEKASYRVLNGFQIPFALWLLVYGFILFAAVSKSGIFMFSFTSGITTLSGLALIFTSIHEIKHHKQGSL